MQLEPGMRVRCVKPDVGRYLTLHKEYQVIEADAKQIKILDDTGCGHQWSVERFRPVVRVKAIGLRLSSYTGPIGPPLEIICGSMPACWPFLGAAVVTG